MKDRVWNAESMRQLLHEINETGDHDSEDLEAVRAFVLVGAVNLGEMALAYGLSNKERVLESAMWIVNQMEIRGEL